MIPWPLTLVEIEILICYDTERSKWTSLGETVFVPISLDDQVVGQSMKMAQTVFGSIACDNCGQDSNKSRWSVFQEAIDFGAPGTYISHAILIDAFDDIENIDLFWWPGPWLENEKLGKMNKPCQSLHHIFDL